MQVSLTCAAAGDVAEVDWPEVVALQLSRPGSPVVPRARRVRAGKSDQRARRVLTFAGGVRVDVLQLVCKGSASHARLAESWQVGQVRCGRATRCAKLPAHRARMQGLAASAILCVMHVRRVLDFAPGLECKSAPRCLCMIVREPAQTEAVRGCVRGAGKTMGVVGYGDIGQACGKLAKAFKMRVIALRRRAHLSDEDREAGILSEVFSNDQKAEMVSQCDYVVMATPFTDATHKLFDAEAVNAMKPTAVFVNVGRGKCVDEEALVDALQAGKLAELCVCHFPSVLCYACMLRTLVLFGRSVSQR